MSSPFDDPEVEAQMARAGIVHRPGLAAEMMDELAPLLAAEGIDLNDPESAADLDTLNAALARATERYNLELFTPVGDHRSQALDVLTEFTGAVTRKRSRAAEDILDSIQPDATAERPAASHVIGVSLGLLDEWYPDPAIGDVLRDVPVPKWRGPARSVAAGLIKAARRGGAYTSLQELTVRHGGRLVMHAAALAVAATILASAARQAEDVPTAAARLYAHEAGPARTGSTADGSAFGGGASTRVVARRFQEWLAGEEDAPDPDRGRLFDRLVDFARGQGLDVEVPDDVVEIAETILDREGPESAGIALDLLHDYVHFQQETGNDHALWAEAHEAVIEMLEDADPLTSLLADTVDEARDTDPTLRRAGLARLPIVAGVKPLLEWLAQPRPITQTGGLRLADIAPVAAMIGVSATGVRQRPTGAEPLDPMRQPEAPELPQGGTIRARSIKDVPVLHAWWHALETAGLIELTATRVRSIGSVEADGLPDLKTMDVLAPYFLADLLLGQMEGGVAPLGQLTLRLVVNRLLVALAPEEYALGSALSELSDLLVPAVDRQIAMLRQVGLIAVDADGRESVPEPARGVVATGALAVLAAVVGDEED